MAIIIGREKNEQPPIERADVINGLKERRLAAARQKEEQKALAEEERLEAEAKASRKRVRGRKAAVKGAAGTEKGGADEQ